MSSVFTPLYADTYDALYREKDYAGECTVIERLFAEHADERVRSLLDLGCGTGNHAVAFGRRGYDVLGIERSDTMVKIARDKTADLENVEIRQGDIRSFELDRFFDAALLLFAVLGYLSENEDILQALAAVRRHLRPGGLLVFDIWYGPAVLHERPTSRFSVIPLDGGELLRAVHPRLDTRKQLCHVHYDLWQIREGAITATDHEDHTMRFFFPREIELLVTASGFTLERVSAFPEIASEPDETTWNVVAVARATETDDGTVAR